MSAVAIIAIAIAATGILLMRFRKRWLAKINSAVTNRITSLFAGWLPGFGILTHVGRRSGKVYAYWFGGSMFSGNQQLTRLSGDVVQPTVAQRVAHFSPKTIFYPPERADATQI